MSEAIEIEFMRSSQLVVELAPSATHLREQLERLESAIRLQDCPGTVDCSKSLLESLFKTIIQDVDGTVDANLDFTQLFRKVREKLNFSSDNQAHEWLGQICSTAVAKIAELRNRFGAIGHGADGYTISPLERPQTEFIASITDSVATFLFQIHKTNPERFRHHRIHYQDNPDFNDFLDEQFPSYTIVLSQKGNSVYSASEVLFNTDYDGYKAMLIQFKEGGE